MDKNIQAKLLAENIYALASDLCRTNIFYSPDASYNITKAIEETTTNLITCIQEIRKGQKKNEQ